MSEILPPLPLLAAFLAASFVLAITPGPGVLYIVARSLEHGRRSGLASVGGVALGNLGNAIGAGVGLAALFAVSSSAFLVVKYAGAVYLVYLGVRTLKSSQAATQTRRNVARSSASRVLREGFLVALLNPKTAVFFAAFLPQFMAPHASALVQSTVLGALFVGIAAATDTAYALVAGAASGVLARSQGVSVFGRYVTGGTLIGLGLFTAFGGARSNTT